VSLFQVRHYLKHLFSAKSTAGHGIHSPFVYQLVTTVLTDQRDVRFNEVEALRKTLLSNGTKIRITDLGAGSKKLNNHERSVSSIAQTSLKPAKYARLIARLAEFQKCKTAIELGTSFGLTSAYLSKVCNKIVSIEGCPNIAALAIDNLQKLQVENVTVKIGSFDDLLMPTLIENPNCTLVYIDGNHTYQSTLQYYYQLRKMMPVNSLLIFDDIYWSKEMMQAWRKITSESTNQITIDLFHLGLVYLKADQATENFSIRI
jgi:predicted O-methyltransferase YrrM